MPDGRKKVRPTGAQRNRCMNCGADPYPRTFYFSDRCSKESRAQTVANRNRSPR